jgi:chemotaxis protein CheD
MKSSLWDQFVGASFPLRADTPSSGEYKVTTRMELSRTIYLQIGECIVTRSPMVISTVLGSCVAATFFHAPSGFSAIFHAMLPSSLDGEEMEPCRYVDSSIALIVRLMERDRIEFRSVTVKIFGGSSSIITSAPAVNRITDVGAKNVETARKEIQSRGFSTACEDVGGTSGRKVLFSTTDGSVLVKKLGVKQIAN